MTKEEKENIKRELVLWFENSENERIGIALKKLISTEFNIIELRYKYGMCWQHIAKKANLSYMSCFRIHNKALDVINKLFINSLWG